MAITLRFALVLVVGLLLAAGPALAAGGGGGTRSTKDTNYTQAEKLIKDGKYADAIPLLNKAVKANPKSADAYNYLGYSYRQLGQFDSAMGLHCQICPLIYQDFLPLVVPPDATALSGGTLSFAM